MNTLFCTLRMSFHNSTNRFLNCLLRLNENKTFCGLGTLTSQKQQVNSFFTILVRSKSICITSIVVRIIDIKKVIPNSLKQVWNCIRHPFIWLILTLEKKKMLMELKWLFSILFFNEEKYICRYYYQVGVVELWLIVLLQRTLGSNKTCGHNPCMIFCPGLC